MYGCRLRGVGVYLSLYLTTVSLPAHMQSVKQYLRLGFTTRHTTHTYPPAPGPTSSMSTNQIAQLLYYTVRARHNKSRRPLQKYSCIGSRAIVVSQPQHMHLISSRLILQGPAASTTRAWAATHTNSSSPCPQPWRTTGSPEPRNETPTGLGRRLYGLLPPWDLIYPLVPFPPSVLLLLVMRYISN